MALLSFVRVIRRWLWLIVLAAFVAGGATYAVSKAQPPQYEASVTMQIGVGGRLPTLPDLTKTYAVLVKTYPILEATINKLSLPLTPDDLSKLIQTRIMADTTLLIVSVTYSDPVRAADIANELARQLTPLSQGPTNSDQQQQIALLLDEINKTYTQLQAERSQLDALDKQLTGTPSTESATLTAQRQALVNQITAVQSNLAQMVNALAIFQQGIDHPVLNTLPVVEPARPPKNPVSDSTWVNAGLAAMVAAILAAGVGLVIDMTRQRTRRQPVNLEPAPVLSPENVPAVPAPPGNSVPKPTTGSKKHRVKT